MNRTFFGILLVVCLLGMALAMFSERLSRAPENGKSMQMAAADTQLPNLAKSDSASPSVISEAPEESVPSAQMPEDKELAAETEKRELAAAEAALAPPARRPEMQREAASPEPETLPGPVVSPEQDSRRQPQISAPEIPPQAAPIETPAKPAVQAAKPEPVRQPAKPAETVQPSKPQNSGAGRQMAAGAKKVNNFVVFAREKGATVRIGGNAKIKYSSMTLENPNRVVLDMDGDWEFPERLPIPKNEMVSGIRVGKNGDKTRVVIDLKAKPRISRMVNNQNGASIDVRVDK